MPDTDILDISDPIARAFITLRESNDQRAIADALDELTAASAPVWRAWDKHLDGEAEQLARVALWQAAKKYEYDPDRAETLPHFVLLIVRNKLICEAQRKQRKCVIPEYRLVALDAPRVEERTLADIIPDPNNPNPAEAAEEAEFAERLWKWLSTRLTPQEYEDIVSDCNGTLFWGTKCQTKEYKRRDNSRYKAHVKLRRIGRECNVKTPDDLDEFMRMDALRSDFAEDEQEEFVAATADK